MTTASTGRPRALLLIVMALLASVATIGGLARPASAASASLPDASKTGSITIHKFQTPDASSCSGGGSGGNNLAAAPPCSTGLPNDGTAVDTTGLTPMAGVTFSVQKVTGINLTTNQGWQDATTLSGSFDPADAPGSITAAGYGLAAAAGSPVTTDATGTAAVSALPLGLYLVTETSWPAGVTPSAPFLVSVPLTDPDNHNAWIYDVNVYPKNAVTTVTKTVKDDNAVKLGDPVTWTITADIPNVATIDGYKITDQLDTKLDYSSAVATLADGTALTQGTDYTVAFDAASHTLTVDFTAAGRAILAGDPSTKVLVTVKTSANAVGDIVNTAVLYPNKASFGITPGQPGGPVVSPPVDTKWGAMTVLKTDPNGTALAGAVFSVYASAADAQAGTNPISIGGKTTFTSAADGTLTISGLRYSDYADGAAVAPGDPGYQDYYLAEVQAPAGYELLAEPIKFDITAATTAVGVDLTVKDAPSNGGFTLPFTGGPGGMLVYLGGALLLAGALVIGAARRREGAGLR